MRTNFSAAQRAEPDIDEAARIIERCDHFGFCTNTCPTYVLTRDENDAPRGRIELMRAMLERGGAPDDTTVHHLDRCLSCLSCMTTCAVKVDYAHLIDHARVHIERHYRRPWGDRLLRAMLARVIPHPRRLRAAMALGRAARPFARWLPGRLGGLSDMATAATGSVLTPRIFPAQGQRRRRVALLAGCAQQVLAPAINDATIRVLTRAGCEVTVAAGAGCCGSLTLHMGRRDDAIAAAKANVRAWANGKFDAIVINASGCGTTVKDYGHLLARDALAEPAARIAAITRDVAELLHEMGLPTAIGLPRWRVAYSDPCSMQHGQRVVDQPRALLATAGFAVVDVPERHFCCGSAGTYNLLQPAMASALGQRKAAHIASTDADIVATGNIGCMVQLARHLGRPVVHSIELLDWATGGPKPRALAGVTLRAPAPPDSVTAPAEPSAGIW